MIRLYHGTTAICAQSILLTGFKNGSFANDPAMVLEWRGTDTVVLEFLPTSEDLSILSPGARPVVQGANPMCTQYDLRIATILDGIKFRLMADEELTEHRKYRNSLKAMNS